MVGREGGEKGEREEGRREEGGESEEGRAARKEIKSPSQCIDILLPFLPLSLPADTPGSASRRLQAGLGLLLE